jgi:histidinol-phosphate aminotransferase
MIPCAKNNLISLYRDQEYSKSREGYLCLDRNERQIPFSYGFIKKMEKLSYDQLVRHYPNHNNLLGELSKLTGYREDSHLLTPGADGAIKSIFEALITKGDKILCLNPSYQMYEIYAKIYQCDFIGLKLDKKFKLDINKIIKLIKNVKIIFLANPNQPTGSLVPRDEIIALLNLAKNNRTLLVIDEAYYPFSGSTSINLLKAYENLIIIRSFSKAFGMAGLRLGFAVGEKNIINILSKVASAYPINNFALSVGSIMLRQPAEYLEYIEKVKESIEVYTPRINKLGCNVLPTYTNFINIQLPNIIKSDDLVEGLKRNKILVKGSYNHPMLKNSIRVTVPDKKNMKIFYDRIKNLVCTPRGVIESQHK